MTIPTVTTLPVASLKPHPRNYKGHPDDQIEHLAQSIREHGLYRNVVVARDRTILAGHGVVLAARALGIESVPVVQLDLEPDSPRAMKLLIGDNEIAHLAEVDDRVLADMLRDLSNQDLDGLLGTGYDDMMLANLAMVTRPASEIKDFDAAAEWAGMPEYQPVRQTPAITVRFRDDDARSDFAARLGVTVDDDTKSLRWPERENEDVASVRLKG